MLVGRTLGLQLATAGVTIVLARLLTPADYGLFAIAVAVQLAGQRATELGLPAALIRLDDEPSQHLQAAVFGLMLAIAAIAATLVLVVAFVVAPAVWGSSEALEVIAVAILAIPLYSARATPVMLMERQLRFGRIAIVETVDTLVFNSFAVVAAIAGLGAFSLAGAVPAGGLIGLLVAWRLQRFALWPRIDLTAIRPLIGFGAKVSTLQAIYLLKELGFVVLLTAVGGAAVAGFFSMAKRLFSFPIAVTTAVGRVSYPALARDSAQRASRAVRLTGLIALATALPLALVAGAAQPLVALLLGDRWLPTADIVVIGSIGMLLTASALSTLNSYELAEGRVAAPIASAIAEMVLLCGISAGLVDLIGATSVGIAVTVSAAVATVVLAAGTDPLVRPALPPVLRTLAIGTAAAGAAQALQVSHDFAGLIVAVACVAVVWTALESAFARTEMQELIGLARPILRRGD